MYGAEVSVWCSVFHSKFDLMIIPLWFFNVHLLKKISCFQKLRQSLEMNASIRESMARQSDSVSEQEFCVCYFSLALYVDNFLLLLV